MDTSGFSGFDLGTHAYAPTPGLGDYGDEFDGCGDGYNDGFSLPFFEDDIADEGGEVQDGVEV